MVTLLDPVTPENLQALVYLELMIEMDLHHIHPVETTVRLHSFMEEFWLPKVVVGACTIHQDALASRYIDMKICRKATKRTHNLTR